MLKPTFAPNHLFRRSAAMLALAAGFLAPWAVHAQSWMYCAPEGQICNVPGAATVRFGIDGRFEYRNVNGPIPCTPDAFGDPARGSVKQCTFRMGHNRQDAGGGGWAGGSGWGGRPASGNPGGANSSNVGWQVCALEGEHCQFRGVQEVRFGAVDSYAARTANGGVACDVQHFGDPAPGVRKMCLVRSDTAWNGSNNGDGHGQGYGAGNGVVNGGYAPAPGNPANDGNWRFCAEEDQQCNPPRGATVRFGTGGRYAYMNGVNGSVRCHVSTFGDPNPGERKRCEFSR